MTREQFITKWLGTPRYYDQPNMDEMRADLDSVIEEYQSDAVPDAKYEKDLITAIKMARETTEKVFYRSDEVGDPDNTILRYTPDDIISKIKEQRGDAGPKQKIDPKQIFASTCDIMQNDYGETTKYLDEAAFLAIWKQFFQQQHSDAVEWDEFDEWLGKTCGHILNKSIKSMCRINWNAPTKKDKL